MTRFRRNYSLPCVSEISESELTGCREIVYDGDECKWGFQIKECGQESRFFKLDLDPSQQRDSPLASKYVDHTCASPDHDPEKLTTDFLTAIRRHVERVLRHSIPESALLSTPIEYIVCSEDTPKMVLVVLGSSKSDNRPGSVV